MKQTHTTKASAPPVSGWDSLRRLGRRQVLHVTFRGLAVFFATILLVIVIEAAFELGLSTPRALRAVAGIFPGDAQWAQLSSQAIRSLRQTNLTWRITGRLVPCVIACLVYALVSLRRGPLSVRLCRTLLPTPRHRAAGLVMECVRLRTRNSAVAQFLPLLMAMVAALGILAVASLPQLTVETLRRAWFLPAALILLPVLMAWRQAAWNRRLLERMQIDDAYAPRFHRVGVCQRAVMALSMTALVGLLLAVTPMLTNSRTGALLDARRQARQTMDRYVTRHAAQADPAQLHSYRQLAGRLEATGLQTRMTRVRAVGWQLYVAGALLVGGMLAATALSAPPRRSRAARRVFAVVRTWGAAALAVGSVCVYFRFAAGWSGLGMVLYVAGVGAGWSALLWLAGLADRFGSPPVCPHCQRTVERNATTCPTCGIRLRLARRKRANEFILSKASRVVHHRSCGSLTSKTRRRRTAGTLREAMANFGPDWPLTARPCKLCLGRADQWTGDPVLVMRRRWVRWLVRRLSPPVPADTAPLTPPPEPTETSEPPRRAPAAAEASEYVGQASLEVPPPPAVGSPAKATASTEA